MGTINETILFKNFIKKLTNKKLIDFIENLENSEETNLDDYCSYTKATEYVCRAFDWDNSLFGYEYWEAVDAGWMQVIHNYKDGIIFGPDQPQCKSIW